MWIKINNEYLLNLDRVRWLKVGGGNYNHSKFYIYADLKVTEDESVTVFKSSDKAKVEKVFNEITQSLLSNDIVYVVPKEEEV